MVSAIVILLLVAIAASLAFGLFALLADDSQRRRSANALTWRIGLSVLLIGLVIVGYLTGYVHPHNLGH